MDFQIKQRWLSLLNLKKLSTYSTMDWGTIRIERIDSIVTTHRLTVLYFHPRVLNFSYMAFSSEVMIGTWYRPLLSEAYLTIQACLGINFWLSTHNARYSDWICWLTKVIGTSPIIIDMYLGSSHLAPRTQSPRDLGGTYWKCCH